MKQFALQFKASLIQKSDFSKCISLTVQTEKMFSDNTSFPRFNLKDNDLWNLLFSRSLLHLENET